MSQLKNTPYRIIPLSRAILLKLYIRHVNDEEPAQLSDLHIQKLFAVPVGRNLIRAALDHARGSSYGQDQYIARATDKGTGGKIYRITQDGIMLVERTLRRTDSDLSYLMENGDTALDDVAGIDSIYLYPTERIDNDPWTPLELNRSDPDYLNVVKTVEDAVEIIRGDNGYAANDPKERQGILAALTEGLNWLKDKAPTRAQLVQYLIDPFKWVAARFANAAIGEAAKSAAARVM